MDRCDSEALRTIAVRVANFRFNFEMLEFDTEIELVVRYLEDTR